MGGGKSMKNLLFERKFFISFFRPLNLKKVDRDEGNEKETILEHNDDDARNNKKLFMKMLGTISHNLFMCVLRGGKFSAIWTEAVASAAAAAFHNETSEMTESIEKKDTALMAQKLLTIFCDIKFDYCLHRTLISASSSSYSYTLSLCGWVKITLSCWSILCH